jgi:hypothetical protein
MALITNMQTTAARWMNDMPGIKNRLIETTLDLVEGRRALKSQKQRLKSVGKKSEAKSVRGKIKILKTGIKATRRERDALATQLLRERETET